MIAVMDTLSPASLPDDVDALKAIITSTQEALLLRDEKLISQLAAIKSRDAELYAQGLLIEKLRAMLHHRNTQLFGSKAEGLDQLQLTLEELEIDQARRLPPVEEAPDAPKTKPKRKALPDYLPRDERRHRPNDVDCDCCGKPLRKMAEEIREILNYVPASFRVTRHIIEKFSCRDCGKIVEGELPTMPIEKGMAGAGLLAHILVSKYADALPLYRQSEIYAREGVDLSRSTMASWVGRMANLLAPLAERIERHVLSGEAIHTDDTPVPVLDPGRGKTKTGRLWTYVRDERPWGSSIPPAAFYKYSPDRKGARPRDHLKDYAGHMHADGFPGYEKLYGYKIIEVACMAHVRRKFVDIHKSTASPIAEEAILRIAELYEVEKRANGKPPDERRRLRQADAKERFEELQKWLEAKLTTIPGRSSLAMAMRYAITRMKRMAVYLDDGRLALDNNAAERSVRGIAIGKKNWLFAGSDNGGDSAAVIYSLIETAKLNRVNPQAWLTHIIENIADHPMKQIDDLLPWNWRDNDSAD